jgi:NAD(P)-dependent dehydrogenase (short-subunit alcohol dehydrogenase family)
MSMDTLDIGKVLKDVRTSNVTKTIHAESYDAISPTRPELNQAGKVVLITGGGTGAGFAIATAFITASADTVIICGRRTDVLEAARAKLEAEAKSAGTGTKVIARTCDIAKDLDVDALWQFFSDQKLVIDVYVANAAAFSEPKPMMEMGANKVWSMFETNVKSPLYFTEKFSKQPGEKQKVLSASPCACSKQY